MVALRRFCLTTKRRTPACSQPLTIFKPSAHCVAMGFSVITCFPARATSSACSACSPLGVVKTTISISNAVNISDSFAKGFAPVSAAATSSAFGSMSHIPTSSAVWLCFSIEEKWLRAIRPQPTSANRTFLPVIP